MATLRLEHVNKYYTDKQAIPAVHGLNLDIADKEFLVLLGPSGCGKSTTLRMIAGLESISEGTLTINGERANDRPPKARHIAMVFQNYALYPHMSVYDNMAFGLKIRGMKKQEIAERVQKAAETLGLTDYLARKPKALSGGQRQRVALGRAMVRSPQIFLMDEPLSNLDAKLRAQMREEIVRLHHELGVTTIYVTHDQTEAMTMADRLVIMNQGEIQQIGTPEAVYEKPANRFVAGFIGSPAMNFFRAELRDNRLAIGDQLVRLPEFVQADVCRAVDGQPAFIVGIRAEDLRPVPEHGDLQVTLERSELLGYERLLHLSCGAETLVVRVPAADFSQQAALSLAIDWRHLHCFDSDSGQRLY
ncbi:MAG: sn-glycerol-3-phosphate ABC transporter ATP-binding protein UgpC [Sporolactobacillus sp.]